MDSEESTGITRAPHVHAITRLQLLFENCKLKRGHNYVKKYRVTCPTGMDSPLDSKQLNSEFQVNIFSNDRDMRKC